LERLRRWLDYFTQLAAARSPLPLFVYSNPLYTRSPLGPEVILALLELPNVAGLKHSEDDLGQLVEIIHHARVVRGLRTGLSPASRASSQAQWRAAPTAFLHRGGNQPRSSGRAIRRG
jgi:hypothetical protein